MKAISQQNLAPPVRDRDAAGVKLAIVLASVLLLLAGCASRPAQELVDAPPIWQLDFQHPVNYHMVISDDLLLVGTTRHLFGVNPITGEQRWRLRNVNTTSGDVLRIPGASYLLINDAAGGAFDDAGSYIIAVDRDSGQIRWESPIFNGRVLQGRADAEAGRLYAVIVPRPHGDDRGVLADILPNKGLFSGFEREPELLALDLAGGQLLWRRPFGEKVLMRPAYRPGTGGAGARSGVRPFDLDLYHQPVLVADQVCVTYAGIHCFDQADGALVWSEEYRVIESELALSYPEPVIHPDLLITGSTDQLFAFNPQDGRQYWQSEKLGRMPALLDDGEILLVQVGGRYFDLDSESWVAKGGFAAAALNKRNGNVLWNYHRVRRSISNLLLAGPIVWFADHQQLFALDRLDGSVMVNESHRLGEPPLYVGLNDNQQIVLISESEVAAYDPNDGRILWYQSYPPPGPGAWKRLAAGLLTASGNLLKLGSLAIDYGGSLVPDVRGKSIVEDVTGSVGRSLAEKGEVLGAEHGFSNLTGNTQYFLTRPRGHDQIALAAVDLADGTTRALTVLPSQAPNLVVDEVNGQVYQVDGKRLIAVALRSH